jgi:hypothetical protein
MIVHVIAQKPNGDLVCDSAAGRICIDPFVGCAVESEDCMADGAKMIGSRFVMSDYFMSSIGDTYLCHRFTPCDGMPNAKDQRADR